MRERRRMGELHLQRPHAAGNFVRYLLLPLLLLPLCGCDASGDFSLQVTSLQALPSGGDALRGSFPSSFVVRVCLGEASHGRRPSPGLRPCPLGSAIARGEGGAGLLLSVAFDFAWPLWCSLAVDVWEQHNGTAPGGDLRQVTRAVHVIGDRPGEPWRTLHHAAAANATALEYRVRVRCHADYYGADCKRWCRRRDDHFGHSECDAHGRKECMPGWAGEYCDRAICRPGCDSLHGGCDVPGQCRCRSGWQGELCQRCVPYPGCGHGSCRQQPWRCSCDSGWGGLLCDKDLNYCASHQPCLNGGSCINAKPDEFTCNCPQGYSGMSCEIGEKVDDDNDDDDDNEEVEEVEECSSVDGVGSSCASSEGVTTIDGGRFVPPASAGVDGEKVDDDNDDDDDNEEVEEVEECSSVDGVGSSCASSEGVTTIDGGRFVPPASAGVDGSLLPVLLPLSLAVCLLSDLAVGRRCRPRCLRRRPREVSWIANNLGGGGDGGGGGGNTEGGRSPKLPPKGPDEVRLEAREMPKLGEQRLPPTPEWGAKFSKLGGLGAEDVNVNNVSRVKIHAATERREGKGSESGGSGVE
ncbi:protein jagged-2-like isoform X2 [Petromyzon marinus]|uniref:protein jagged-2-like isoform X2 n=1 Tax=Petromyzon marinus TaxID=7757 RepID=UPI003F721E90